MPRKAGSKNKVKYFELPAAWEDYDNQEHEIIGDAMSSLEEEIGPDGIAINYGTIRGLRSVQKMLNYIIWNGDLFVIDRQYAEFKNTKHYHRYVGSIEWARVSKIKRSSNYMLTFKTTTFKLDAETMEQLGSYDNYYCVEIDSIKGAVEEMANRIANGVWHAMKTDYDLVALENNFEKNTI